MKFEGIYNGESWKQNEVLERKKKVINKIMKLLQAEDRMERALDSRLFHLSAQGINASGDTITVGFDTTHNLHNDVFSIIIKGIPHPDIINPTKANRHEPSYDREGKILPQILYRLDKTVFDGEEEDPTLMAHVTMSALLSKDTEVPSDADDFIASTYETDEEGRKIKYNDNFSETIVSSEIAEKLIEGLTVNEINSIIE